MTQDENGKTQEYNEAIGALRELKAEPSPFMKTRVMAHVEEERSKSKKSWFMIFGASLATACLAIVLSWQLFQQAPAMAVGESYVVKADLTAFENEAVAYVTIELEGEVKFASKKFAQVEELRSLTLSWDRLIGKEYLPLVIKGVQAGNSKVKLHFYDENDNIIKTKDYDLRFEKG